MNSENISSVIHNHTSFNQPDCHKDDQKSVESIQTIHCKLIRLLIFLLTCLLAIRRLRDIMIYETRKLCYRKDHRAMRAI